MKTTTNYAFKKRELTDVADITATEDNWDGVDAKLKALADANAAHLAEGVQHKIVDPVTGAKFKWGIANGQLYLEEVS